MMISATNRHGLACMILLGMCSTVGQAANVTSSQAISRNASAMSAAANVSMRAMTGNDAIFGNGFEYFPISISPGDWSNAWVGARKHFAALGAGNEGHAPDVVWSSSDDSLLRIDATGLATALHGTSSATLTATSGPYSDSAEVSVAYDGSNGPGVMYSVYFARSDNAPAFIVDGKLVTPEAPFYGNVPWADPIPPWPASRPTVAKFEWEGDYIGLLTDMANGAGTFRAKGRVEDWHILGLANVRDFELVRNLEGTTTALYVALLRDDDALMIKKGIHESWDIQGTAVVDFKLEPNPHRDASIGLIRIGALNLDGSLYVKDGMNGTWTLLAGPGTGVREFQFADNRIGLLLENGLFRVKDGINGPWVTLAAAGTHVRSFQLQGNRIGLLLADGLFLVKDGINGAWTTLAAPGTGARSFQLEGDRIGLLYDDGRFRGKDGIHGAWRTLASSGIDSFQLQGNRIGVLRDNDFLIKSGGLDGAWSGVWHPDGEVTQYRLLVDVPTPPDRTSIATYNQNQAECFAQYGPSQAWRCYPEIYPWVPVAFYGRFCGGGHPDGDDWGWAIGEGPIDGLDMACKHHDLAPEWYPEGGSGDYWVACIVRYALRYSRLTNNGVLLTHGRDDQAGWDSGWASYMPNLKGGLDAYFSYVAGVCNNGNLNDFISDTASTN